MPWNLGRMKSNQEIWSFCWSQLFGRTPDAEFHTLTSNWLVILDASWSCKF